MEVTEYKHFGRMNDPDGSAYNKGICGDEMEFYFIVRKGILDQVLFYTDGCDHTKACGELAASFVTGKSPEEAMEISPAQIRKAVKDLPDDHIHCAVLSTMTLLKALGEYIFKLHR